MYDASSVAARVCVLCVRALAGQLMHAYMRMRIFTHTRCHDTIITHAHADAHAQVPRIVYVMCDLSEACVQQARRLRCFQPLLAARAVDFARCLYVCLICLPYMSAL